MLSSHETKTDTGKITSVLFYRGSALVGPEYCICLDNGHRHFIPMYRLDKKPEEGQTAEITEDLFFRRIISVKFDGAERYREFRPFFS